MIGRREAGEILLKLVEVYTPSGNESRIKETLTEICLKLGFERCYFDEIGNFFAEYGEGEPILLASHIDTVPGELNSSFDGEIIRGRGAVDAKGPLTAFILGASEAMKEISGVKVRVAGLVHEESDGLGAKYLVEKGCKARYVLIGEPTNLGIAIAYRGSVTAEIYAEARGGHSSAPYVGESALDKILNFVGELRSRFNGSSYDEVTSAVTVLNAGDWPSKLPEKARAIVNIRFPKPYSPDSIIEEIEGIAKRSDARIRLIDSTPPVEVGLRSKAVRALMRGCLRNGVKPRLVKKTGTSDMNTLAELTEHIAAFGPGDSKLAHTNAEELSVDDLLKAARIVASALIELSKDAVS